MSAMSAKIKHFLNKKAASNVFNKKAVFVIGVIQP